VLALATATLARWMLAPVLPDTVPFITFFPAVALAAWYGGLWAGVVASLAGYLIADWLFIPPRFTLSLFDPQSGAVPQSIVFVAMSGIIICLTEALRRANTRAIDAAGVALRARKTVEVTLSSIGDGVIATDTLGRITFINPVAEALTGWSNAEAQYQSLSAVFRIVNELTRQPVEDPCAKVLRTGRRVGLANHTVLIDRAGGERPIDDSAAPIIDESGAVLGVVLVFRDATRERQAQEALQRLAAIVEDSQDAIIGKTIDGVITNWNPAAERLYGFTAKEAIGQPISIIVPPDRLEELTEITRRLTRGEHIPAWDTVRRRKDGTLVDVSLQISPIRNSDGEVVGASKVARDITVRRRNEATLSFLAETSANLAALTDRSSALQQAASAMVPFFADWCVVFRISHQGRIEHQACAHRDADQHVLLTQFLEAFPFDWDTPAPTVEALRSGQTQFFAEVPSEIIARIARTPDQLELLRTLRPHSVISVPLRVRDRIVGAMTFVTASDRRYQAQDIPLAEDLGRRVATAIDNAHLFNSLRAADRQKDEFLAMLAHELRARKGGWESASRWRAN
jgi:PAS domain S-box-containing protein